MAYFNFRNLDPTEFEALAKDVMERILGCRLFRYGQGPDSGIDLCDDIQTNHIVVQCKRYLQVSYKQLYNILKREEKPKIDKLDHRPERYYVFTSLELLRDQKLEILELLQEYMENESFIVDGIAINDFFRDEKNHDLIPRNIKLFRYFPENYKYSSADLSQIEENRLYDRLMTIFENDRKNHPSIRMMDPDPSLFPKGLPEILSDGRYAVVDKEAPRSIRDMILDSWESEDRRHILLLGEGGIGKTVAMLMLPKEDWFKKLGIPVIYVPLQRLDAYKGDLDLYIKKKIGSDNYERCIELINSIPGGHPRMLLLLDGFNEIPDSYKKEAGEYIRDWMGKPGIQIITTSRMGFFLENHFLKFRLQPLPYDTVRSFLQKMGITEDMLPGQSDRIWNVINVPLMLTLYTRIEKVREMAEQSSAALVMEWKEPDNAAHIIWDYLQTELYRCIEKNDTAHSAVQYAAAILAIAPYICSRMSQKNKFNIERKEFRELIRDALSFYTAHEDMLDSQILNIRDEVVPYSREDIFCEANAVRYEEILIDNVGLFQIRKSRKKKGIAIDYSCSLMHQNFRDALAAFFICSCLLKASDAEEKKHFLDQADHFVKDYMAEHFSDEELTVIWDRHRKEEPQDGKLTFILMDIIGRQRKYDYREVDFSGLDLTKTNIHRLLSKRLDICPLPGKKERMDGTKASFACISPIGHTNVVNSVAYSPDGCQIASGSEDWTVWIWDLENGEKRMLKGHTGGVRSVAYSPDGHQIASGSEDGTVRIWDLENGESRVLKGHTGGVRSVAYSPDGHQIASGSGDKTVRVWYLESGESRVLEGHTGVVASVAYSPAGRQIASGSEDGAVRIWDLESGESRVLKGHKDAVWSVAYSPDGRHLASGSFDRTVRIWDLESGESRELEGHTRRVYSIAYSPDGRHLASGSGDGAVRIWDLESGENRELEGQIGRVSSVAYSPDGRQLASGSVDHTVRIWDLEREESRVLGSYTGGALSAAYSPSGRQLASGSGDGAVRIWDLESGESWVLEGHTGVVASVAYSPDGRHLASGSGDGAVRIWDLESGENRELEGHTACVNSVAYSPDGHKLASGSFDRTVRIWDLESGENRELDGYTDWVWSAAYSPDGRHLASGSGDGAVRIWDLESGGSRELEGHTGRAYSVAYSPDGKHLASGSGDGAVRIWDLESGESRELDGNIFYVYSATYSPDGRQIAGGLNDGTVRIWDLESGESRELKGHKDAVESVAYSPDGRQITSGSRDGTVRIWNVETYQEVQKYLIIPHINLSGANFELSILTDEDRTRLKMAGAKV